VSDRGSHCKSIAWNNGLSTFELTQNISICRQVQKAPRGNDLMNSISDKIKSGSRAFLVTEYKHLSVFVGVFFAILLVLYTVDPPVEGNRTEGIRYAGSFIVGASLSAGAGWCGMSVATDCNVRTTQAADQYGLAAALRIAFCGGAVMGFTVVGFGLVGVSLIFYLVTLGYDEAEDNLPLRLQYASATLSGFGFGVSSISLFARVAGGIYTKAADVGADLVGKVEMDIPEDDPRNPAVRCVKSAMRMPIRTPDINISLGWGNDTTVR
jgi:K(+)-stimulated pyrophosphate-energized sodium pump